MMDPGTRPGVPKNILIDVLPSQKSAVCVFVYGLHVVQLVKKAMFPMERVDQVGWWYDWRYHCPMDLPTGSLKHVS